MSVSYTSIKRKQDFPHENKTKDQKITNNKPSTFAPAFWEGLSRVWLTRRALRELDRRNRLEKALNYPSKSPSPSPSHSHSHSHPLPLITYKYPEEIFHIAKSGGFNLTDLRGFKEPMEQDPRNDGSASGTRLAPTVTTRTENSGPRDRNFEQKLSDVGVFYFGNVLPGASPVPEPKNLEQLQEIAFRRRPSLSTDRFTNADYRAFKHIFETSDTEVSIMTNVIPMIEGTCQGRGLSCANKPFNNLLPLAAGIVCGTPDKCYGSNSAEVDEEVQRELGNLIIPSTAEGMPVAPNFFLEVKGRFGMPGVADRQALHTGALGERGQIALRAWRRDGSGLDKMAHTITSKYQDGFITIYSIHVEESRIQDNRTDYYMNRIFSCSITNGAESFRTGVSAYRNLRDFAEEQRRQSIDMANSMIQRTGDAAE